MNNFIILLLYPKIQLNISIHLFVYLLEIVVLCFLRMKGKEIVSVNGFSGINKKCLMNVCFSI